MGAVKINGTTSGSVSLEAPATGSDVTLTLPDTTMNLGTELASKLPIAGGKILQIVRATDSTVRSTTSTSYVDASISVTITPQKSDSAVLLIWRSNLKVQATGSFSPIAGLRITDNSNNAISGAETSFYGLFNSSTTTDEWYGPGVEIAYATPATTSAVTFKGRFRVTGGNQNVTIENASATGQMYAIEVSA